jgi:serine/threonine protein kinase
VPGYEILKEIGRGGLGTVYEARDTTSGRLVAVKMLQDWGDSAQDRPSFLAEAEALARLQHPNIVQMHQLVEQGGHKLLFLEFVEGVELWQKLDGTPWPPDQAAELLETLARAMHHAHERGVVHRDLKPSNICITADGSPKVMDFGLAKLLDREDNRTGAGSVDGTASYMAPEQAAGNVHETGPAADVYSLGAILYELLTGRPPFKADTILDLLTMVQSENPVPPRVLQPALPRDLEAICLKCLQKDPRSRYATAGDLANDLSRFRARGRITNWPIRLWEWARGAAEKIIKWMGVRPAVLWLLLLALSFAGVLRYILG